MPRRSIAESSAHVAGEEVAVEVDRPRKREVVGRHPARQDRGDEHCLAQPGGDLGRQVPGDDGVRAERQVRAVLLDRAGPDQPHDAPLRRKAPRLGGGQQLELHAGHSRYSAASRRNARTTAT
jgi:hypothetical protein